MKISWRKISLQDLAAIVSRKLLSYGVEAILVGGACVSIYSNNKYQSNDLDLITYSSLKTVASALGELGFIPQSSRHFKHPECPFYIEFISPPVAIGEEPIEVFAEWRTSRGKIKLLTPTDCVKDRLAAYFYWDDFQAFNQAIMVAGENKIDFKKVRQWADKENHLNKYNEFAKKMRNIKA
jgi:hypothetical protein